MLNFHKCTRSKLSCALAQLSSPGPCCLHKSRLLTVLTLLSSKSRISILFGLLSPLSHSPQRQCNRAAANDTSVASVKVSRALFEICSSVNILLRPAGEWWWMETLAMRQHVNSQRLKIWSFPRKANWDNFSSPLAVSEVILQSVLWELCKLSRTHRVEIGNAVRITLQLDQFSSELCVQKGERGWQRQIFRLQPS